MFGEHNSREINDFHYHEVLEGMITVYSSVKEKSIIIERLTCNSLHDLHVEVPW
jgi:hypothetical protein